MKNIIKLIVAGTLLFVANNINAASLTTVDQIKGSQLLIGYNLYADANKVMVSGVIQQTNQSLWVNMPAPSTTYQDRIAWTNATSFSDGNGGFQARLTGRGGNAVSSADGGNGGSIWDILGNGGLTLQTGKGGDGGNYTLTAGDGGNGDVVNGSGGSIKFKYGKAGAGGGSAGTNGVFEILSSATGNPVFRVFGGPNVAILHDSGAGSFYADLFSTTNLAVTGIRTNGATPGQVITYQGDTTTWSNPPAGGSASVLITNSLFVSKGGNDSTGVRGRVDLPFLTIAGARDKAIIGAGDTIFVYPGTYAETKNLLTNNVNYHFYNGAIVTYTDSQFRSQFDDQPTGPTTNSITGDGVFAWAGTTATVGIGGTVHLTNNLSKISFHAKALYGTGFVVTNALLTVKDTYISMTNTLSAVQLYSTNNVKFVSCQIAQSSQSTNPPIVFTGAANLDTTKNLILRECILVVDAQTRQAIKSAVNVAVGIYGNIMSSNTNDTTVTMSPLGSFTVDSLVTAQQ